MTPSRRSAPRFVTFVGLAIAAGSVAFAAESEKSASPPARGGTVVGGALPGGAVLSSAFVSVVPVAGGDVVCVPLAPDGSFKLSGLSAGRYRLAITSHAITKQTQGATFGEKVNAGLQTAGSGARASDSMPNRISMNVTVPKQNRTAVLDGPTVEFDVGADGQLAGLVAPVAEVRESPARPGGGTR